MPRASRFKWRSMAAVARPKRTRADGFTKPGMVWGNVRNFCASKINYASAHRDSKWMIDACLTMVGDIQSWRNVVGVRRCQYEMIETVNDVTVAIS